MVKIGPRFIVPVTINSHHLIMVLHTCMIIMISESNLFCYGQWQVIVITMVITVVMMMKGGHDNSSNDT